MKKILNEINNYLDYKEDYSQQERDVIKKQLKKQLLNECDKTYSPKKVKI